MKATAETFPLIFSRGAKDAITGELEEGYREKREMAIKPDMWSQFYIKTVYKKILKISREHRYATLKVS